MASKYFIPIIILIADLLFESKAANPPGCSGFSNNNCTSCETGYFPAYLISNSTLTRCSTVQNCYGVDDQNECQLCNQNYGLVAATADYLIDPSVTCTQYAMLISRCKVAEMGKFNESCSLCQQNSFLVVNYTYQNTTCQIASSYPNGVPPNCYKHAQNETKNLVCQICLSGYHNSTNDPITCTKTLNCQIANNITGVCQTCADGYTKKIIDITTFDVACELNSTFFGAEQPITNCTIYIDNTHCHTCNTSQFLNVSEDGLKYICQNFTTLAPIENCLLYEDEKNCKMCNPQYKSFYLTYNYIQQRAECQQFGNTIHTTNVNCTIYQDEDNCYKCVADNVLVLLDKYQQCRFDKKTVVGCKLYTSESQATCSECDSDKQIVKPLHDETTQLCESVPAVIKNCISYQGNKLDCDTCGKTQTQQFYTYNNGTHVICKSYEEVALPTTQCWIYINQYNCLQCQPGYNRTRTNQAKSIVCTQSVLPENCIILSTGNNCDTCKPGYSIIYQYQADFNQQYDQCIPNQDVYGIINYDIKNCWKFYQSFKNCFVCDIGYKRTIAGTDQVPLYNCTYQLQRIEHCDVYLDDQNCYTCNPGYEPEQGDTDYVKCVAYPRKSVDCLVYYDQNNCLKCPYNQNLVKTNSSANVGCQQVNPIENCVYYKDTNNCFQCLSNNTHKYYPIQENDYDRITCISLNITQDSCLVLLNQKDCKICETGYLRQRTQYLQSPIICSNQLEPTLDNRNCEIYQDNQNCDTCAKGFILKKEGENYQCISQLLEASENWQPVYQCYVHATLTSCELCNSTNGYFETSGAVTGCTKTIGCILSNATTGVCTSCKDSVYSMDKNSSCPGDYYYKIDGECTQTAFCNRTNSEGICELCRNELHTEIIIIYSGLLAYWNIWQLSALLLLLFLRQEFF